MRRLGCFYRVAPASTLLLVFVLRQVLCSGVFELRLSSFVNDLARDAEGKCCAAGVGVPSSAKQGTRCPGVCRTYFRVCLKHYQTNVDPNPPCTFGDIITPVLGNNSVHLTDNNNINVPGFTNPLRFPFTFSWPGTFSLVVEAWHEPIRATSSGGAPSSPALITRLTTQGWLAVGLNWTNATHQNGNITLHYAYRVHCDVNYYGNSCGGLCRPRDDKFGHYNCSPTGAKVCLPGWTGEYCTKAVCDVGCHDEHGGCDVPGECKCRMGWQGKLCDQCIRYPGCMQGTCNSPWQCNCDEGWGGLFCNQDLNYCTNHKPCKNGGTCTNTGSGLYTCNCSNGYVGKNCETKQDDCAHQPCLNGGTCKGVAANYTCACPLGFRGRHCEASTATCAERPCRNGATCTNGADGFVCQCPPGYAGANCERETDDCNPNPCANGGQCQDLLNGFRCSCPKGFAGANCEVNIDDCEQNPCANGGSCLDQVNTYKCACKAGFIGTLCETNFNDCLTGPCANGGTCRDLVNGYECTCPPGFTGHDCSVSINECASSPCANGATCEDLHNEYRCRCASGFAGKRCDQSPGDGSNAIAATVVVGTSAATVEDNEVRLTAGNTSHRISDQLAAADSDDPGLPTEQVVLIATFSAAVPIIALVSIVVILCLRRKRRKAIAEEATSNNGRECAEDEEIRRQNEQNAGVHSMNNKCLEGGQIIVNALDKKPSSIKGCYNKMTNEEAMVDNLHSLSTLQRTKSYKHLNADMLADFNSKVHLEKDCDKQQQIINKRTSLSIDVSCTSPSDTILKSAEKDFAAASSLHSNSCCNSPAPASQSTVYVIDEHCSSEAPSPSQSQNPPPAQRYPSDRRFATEV